MRTAIFLIALFLFASLDSTAGVVRTFTSNAPCLACNTPAGLTATNISGTTATLSWDAVGGATKYTVEVQDEQNIPSVFHIETTVSSNSYDVSGLQAGVKYKFKVRTQCGGDKSDWSAWAFFSAGNGGSGGGACDVPTGLAASITGATATLGWIAVSGALGYSIEVEDEQNSPSVFHLKDTSSSNSYTFNGLQTGISYKFKVRTRCASGQSDWSAWQFLSGKGSTNSGSSGICANPGGISANGITSGSASLTWNAVAGVSTYTVEIERLQVGAAPWKVMQTVSANTYLLTGLSPETRYKFKVRSNCPGGGHSAWSVWTKFKTSPTVTGNDPVEDRNAAAPGVAATTVEMQVYPNPVQTDATVRVDGLGVEPATLLLYNATGHRVQEQRLQPENGGWEGRLTVADLPKGVYLVQVRTVRHIQTAKLIVNH